MVKRLIQSSGKVALFIYIICLFFGLSSFNITYAAVGINETINFQGKLVDNNNLNIANSSYSIVFTLYDAASGGTQLWQETQSVTTTDGIFRVALGSVTSLSSVDFTSDQLYLGIKVGADAEMTPRIRFTAVPYAFTAKTALNATNATNVKWSGLTAPTANLSLAMNDYTSTFTYGSATGANNLFTMTDTAANTGTGYLFNLATAAGSNLKPFHVSVNNGGTEALLVDASGNVGVGTTSPGTKFDVWGRVRSTQNGNSYSEFLHSNASGYVNFPRTYFYGYGSGVTNYGMYIASGNATGATQITSFFGVSTNVDVKQASSKQLVFSTSTSNAFIGTWAAETVGSGALDIFIGGGQLDGSTSPLVIKSTGNVGIGDTTPASLFTVGNGDLFQVNSSGAIAAATGISSSGTINFSGLTGSKVVFTDGSKNLTSSGTVGADQGGTGQSTYTTGDILYASGTTTLSKLAATTNGYVLTLTAGVPTWAAAGGSCGNCIINNPTALQTITPSTDVTGLSVRQTSAGSPTADIFNVTNSAGSTKYLQINSAGNVSMAGTLDVTGATTLSSTLEVTGTTNFGGVTYTWPGTAGTNSYVLTTNGAGVLSWSANGSGACGTCIVNNPTALQTIIPSTNVTGLSVRQTSAGSPTADIFNVTNNAGSTKHFKIDSSGGIEVPGNMAIGTTVTAAGSTPKFKAYNNFDLDGTNYLAQFNGVYSGTSANYRGGGVYQILADNFTLGAGTNEVAGLYMKIRTNDEVAGGGSSDSQRTYGIWQDLVTHPQDTSYGIYIRSENNGASTGGTQYGMFLDLNDVDLTTTYGIYQNSANNNYFAGNVGIGTTTYPSNTKLVVSGGAVNVRGTNAGYVFQDRNVTGEDWQWYANGETSSSTGIARLWNSGTTDVLSVTDKGDIFSAGASAIGATESKIPNYGFEFNYDATVDVADGWTSTLAGTASVAMTSTSPGQGNNSQTLTANTGAGNSAAVYSACIPITLSRALNLYVLAKSTVATTGTAGTSGLLTRLEGYTSRANCESRTSATNYNASNGVSTTTSYAAYGATITPGNTITWGRVFIQNLAPTATATYTIDSARLTVSSLAAVADYMEMYPLEQSAQLGDIVATGTKNIITQDGDTIKQLVKTTAAYQTNVIGIVSDKTKAGDNNSIGHNIKEEDNPQPIALSGRVPVKMSSFSQSVAAGDFITVSSEPGKAMKALKSGYMVGKALEDWSASSGKTTVMVYVMNTYADVHGVLDKIVLDTNGEVSISRYDSVLNTLNMNIATQTAQLSTIGSTQMNQNESLTNLQTNITTVRNELMSLTNAFNILVGRVSSAEAQITGLLARLDYLKPVSGAGKIDQIEERIAFLEQTMLSTQSAQASGSALINASGSAVLGASTSAILSDGQVATVSSLMVTGSSNLNELSVMGGANFGLISIDGVNSTLDALGSTLKLQSTGSGGVQFISNKIEMTQQGNLIMKDGNLTIQQGVIKTNNRVRDGVTVTSGQSSVTISGMNWQEAPVAITANASYDSYVWITDITTDGFIIHIKNPPSTAQKIYWQAMW